MTAIHKVRPRDLMPGMRMARVNADLADEWVPILSVQSPSRTTRRYKVVLAGDHAPVHLAPTTWVEVSPVPLIEVLAEPAHAATAALQAQVLLDPPQASADLVDLGVVDSARKHASGYWHRRLAVGALERLTDQGLDDPDLRGHTITVTISADGTTATATDITPGSR